MSTARKNIMLGTAGHVDHGKSALVKLLTGCETDTLAEEKQRGLTIDLGFAPCRLADARIVGVVDVPGHVDFIRNMVAGAHGIDVVILVVAADDGIMPQTHEHLHILTLMGLRHGLVALTKIDLVEPARRDFVAGELHRLLAGTFLDHAPICPISNVTGEGFESFFTALNEVVNACEDRKCSGFFRLWVDDAFTIRGSGTVITGIPASGALRVGKELTLLPAGLSGHVRRMQVYGEEAAEGRAGECVALNIPEIDYQSVRRGMVLCEAGAPEPVSIVEAELQVLNSVRGSIEDYLEVQMHVGTVSTLAHIAMLEGDAMMGGQKQLVQLRFAQPLPLLPGERFVVRANLGAPNQTGLATIGGGRILGISNSRLRRKKQWTLDLLSGRAAALENPLRWCELMLRESPQPATASQLDKKGCLGSGETAPLLEALRAEERAVRFASGAFVHAEVGKQAAARVVEVVRAFQESNPQSLGIGREELAAKLGLPAELLEWVIEMLVQTKQLDRQGTVLAQAGWRARLPDREERLCEQVAASFKSTGWNSPALADLGATLREPSDRLERTVRLLMERGVLVRLDERILMHRDAIEAAKQVVMGLFRKAPSFTTMQFRDAVNVSRKYAVPLLDYLDRARFTVRSGHDRTPGVEAKKLLKPATPT